MNNKNHLSFPLKGDFDMGAFSKGLSNMIGYKRTVLFLCIGTDCSTGDSLGPLVGHQLADIDYEDIHIIGSLKHPVTALNLEQVLDRIYHVYPNACIIAIDAAIGNEECIGQITVSKRPLRPGLGVKKSLPAVGEISITGIIGSFSLTSPSDLQGIRLSLVMNMAERISSGIITYCSDRDL